MVRLAVVVLLTFAVLWAPFAVPNSKLASRWQMQVGIVMLFVHRSCTCAIHLTTGVSCNWLLHAASNF